MNRRGHTLLELVVVLALLGLLAAGASQLPAAAAGSLTERAWSDARVIAGGLWGNRDAPGYVDDLGRVAPDFAAMTQQGAQAGASVAIGTAHGWQGPYAGFDLARLQSDPWGRPWRIEADGRVASSGADGLASTADDVVLPAYVPAPNGLAGRAAFTVADEAGRAVSGADVRVLVTTSADGSGAEAAGSIVRLEAIDDGAGRFVATGLSPGRHAVEVTGRSGTSLEGAFGRTVIRIAPGGGATAHVGLRF